ncbi:MAG: mannosyltransferase family protein [Propioniciclava sp.]|uniref:mannosyltransferase family protein n=1 Tax=Propioniciclava sp. TaxID=2038686 RepID=UPI0039E30D80
MATSVRRPSDENLRIVQVWLVTRLLFAIMAVAIALGGGRRLESVIGGWDVGHFLRIAAEGYADPQEMAFFPGWPLILRGFSALGLQPALAGAGIALVCSLLAAFALKRIAGLWGAIAWLLAPTAVFTAVAYTEAPFCAAAFWAWERATERRWGQAALLAALACTLRVSGLFLIGALVILALTQAGRRGDGPVGSRLAWLMLPAAVLIAYITYLYGLTGSWTAWFSAQEAGWNRAFHWPWEAVAHQWSALWRPTPEHPEWVWIFRAEMISWIIGVLVTVIALARKRVAEASWVGVQVLAFSLSYWLMSVNRAVLLWFPLWRLIGEFVESRPRTRAWIILGWTVAVLAVALQCLWAWLFFTGRWSS